MNILLFKVYIILAKPESTEGAGIPCVYALLPNKEMATYLKMFSIIKEHLGDCSKLSTIISDFERAVFQAVYRVFPGIEQRGCRFHFNSAVWKNIGEKGLQSLFYQNPSFQEVFYMLCGLAYVPVDKVQTFYKDYIEKQIEQTLEKDEEWADFEEEIQAFVVYFRKTWIERRGGNSALFAPNLWNQYETILQGGPQTNNMLESYNRTLNSLVGAKTNVWDFLKLVISQEANTRRVFLSNSVGQDLRGNTGRKQAALDNIQRIKYLVTSFNTTPPQEYIQMIGHELQRGS